MTDRAQAGLRGPVRMCAIERDYVYPDHHWVLHTDSTFSEDGNLLEQHHRNPDGSTWSTLCRYDDEGRILQKEHRPEGGAEQPLVEQALSYHYDASGRLERVVARTKASRSGSANRIVMTPPGGRRSPSSPIRRSAADTPGSMQKQRCRYPQKRLRSSRYSRAMAGR